MNGSTRRTALEALQRLPLFSCLAGDRLRDLARECRTLRVPAGESIFSPLDAARSFYVILSGRVKVFQLSPKGDEQILHLYGPGQTFGEAAMWAGGGYPAHASAVEPAELLIVTRAALSAAITRQPELALGMIAGLAVKLREFEGLIEQLALREVPARLASVLLAMSRESGSERIQLRQTKRELAAQIGTVAETLSRALAKLRRQGLIDVEGSRITLLDPDGLAELADS